MEEVREALVETNEIEVDDVKNEKEESKLIEIVVPENEEKIGCKCCLASTIRGGVCYYGPKDDTNTKGCKCNGDITTRIKDVVIKNTDAKPNEKCYFVVDPSLSCMITNGNMRLINLDMSDIEKIMNDEAVLIIDNLMIGVKSSR